MKLFFTVFSLLVISTTFAPQLFGQQSFQFNQVDSQSKQLTTQTLSGADQTRIYFSLNEDPIRRSAIQEGDIIEVQTSHNSYSTLEIVRSQRYHSTTRSYIAKDPDNPGRTFAFTYSEGRVHGTFHKAHDDVYFFEYDSSAGQNYIAKSSPYYDEVHACSVHEAESDYLFTHLPGQVAKKSNIRETTSHVPNASSTIATLEDDVTIDLLMPYTQKAREWAEDSSFESIDAVIAQSLNTSQSALDNSDIHVTLRLVHQYETDYDADSADSLDEDDPDYVSAGDHLRRLTYNPAEPIDFCGSNTEDCSPSDFAGFMEEAHELRNQFGADLVAAVLSEPNTGGIAWLNSSPAGNQILGFSVNRVQQIGNGTTLVHEIGHNMGNAHARNQPNAAADEFGGLFAYSTGNRYKIEDNRYATVMAYNDGGYTGIPYFSNPDISFSGSPTGTGITSGEDAGPANSARSMREIKRVIAAYRPTIVDAPLIDLDESDITAQLDQNNSTVSVPVTIQNNGTSPLLWDFDFDIESGTIASKTAASSTKDMQIAAAQLDLASFAGNQFSQTEHNGEIFAAGFEMLQGFGTGDFAATGGWRAFQTDAPFQISNENASAGGQHLRLPRRSDSSGSVFARSPFFGPQPLGEYTISFDLATEVPADGSGNPLFDAYAYDASTNTITAGIIVSDEGNIFARSINESGEEEFSFTGETLPDDDNYRSFRFAFNPNNRTIDYYLDDDQIASNPYPAGRKPDFIYFGQRNEISGAYMDIDNIMVERVHSPFNWLTTESFGGVIEAGSSETVNLTLSAEDVSTGDYETVLLVRSNDPDNPVLEIPISAQIQMATSAESSTDLPERVELQQNYPNPFNPSTTIQFNLNQTADVTLEVFNITGQRVSTLINGTLNAGSHTQTFNASGLSSGLYIYRLKTPSSTLTRQMILVK